MPFTIIAGPTPPRKDKIADRSIVMAGLGSSSMPEFVTVSVLLTVFCVQLGWFPVFANAPDGSSVVTQFRYLLMPALAMAIVSFGYIARITRAGVITALEADYTRTAVIEGRPADRDAPPRHAQLARPDISVIGVQIGYLFRQPLGVEKVFAYRGLGSGMLNAIGNHDLPVLTASVLIVGIVYMLATLIADLLIAWLNPRVLSGRLTMTDDTAIPDAEIPDAEIPEAIDPVLTASNASERQRARRENLRLVLRRPGFIVGALITLFWIVCYARRRPHHPLRPAQLPGHEEPQPERRLLVRHRPYPRAVVTSDGRRPATRWSPPARRARSVCCWAPSSV